MPITLDDIRKERERRTRTTEGRPIIQNPDGSISTEETITVTEPQINQGRATNIPTIYGGKRVSEPEAIQRIIRSGGIDPDTGNRLISYNTIDQAIQAAQQRTQMLGQTLQPKPGVTLQDIQAERARRARGSDPFNPVDAVPGPSGDRRVFPAQEAIQEALPTSLAGPDVLGSTAGEVIGGGLGTLTGPVAPVAIPVLSSVGAGLGLAVSRWLQGEPVTMQEVTGEALATAIPETIVQGGRALLRASKAAKAARFEDIANQVRHEAGTVFEPPEKALVAQLFNQVAESGVKVDTGAMQRFLGNIGTQYDDLLKEVGRVDTALKTGSEYRDLLGRMQIGQRGAYDIGRLQTLHSELRKRAQTPNMPFEAKELLEEFSGSIDDAIYQGLAKGQNAAQAEAARDTLKLARAGWAKIRRTEELQKVVEGAITADRSGSAVNISLGKIRDTIRKGTGPAGRSIKRSFEHNPEAKESFYSFLDDLAPKHEAVTVTLGDLPPHTLGQTISQLGEWMASIYSNTAGQQAFKDLVISGQGRLTHSTLANLANVARRELEEEQERR